MEPLEGRPSAGLTRCSLNAIAPKSSDMSHNNPSEATAALGRCFVATRLKTDTQHRPFGRIPLNDNQPVGATGDLFATAGASAPATIASDKQEAERPLPSKSAADTEF